MDNVTGAAGQGRAGARVELDLSPRQKAAIGAALTVLAGLVLAATTALVLWLVAAFFDRFSAVFLPLAVAAVVALVFRPYYHLLRRRLRPALAMTVFFLSLLLPLVAFSWFFGGLVSRQVSDLVRQVPVLWERALVEARERWPQVSEFLTTPAGQRIRQAVETQEATLLSGLAAVGSRALLAGAGLVRGVVALLNWLVLPVYLAFFLSADLTPGRSLEGQLPFLKDDTRRDVVYLIRQFVDIVVAFFRGQLVIAAIMGVLFAIGFSIVGLKYGFLLGLVLGLSNVLPYVGSILGLAITLPLAYFQPEGGGLGRLLAVIGVFALVQLLEAYVLTPRIMGQRTGLHPLAIIVAVFFWGSALDGLLGMVLAIPLTAFLVVFWRLARDKYIRAVV
jgi:predicted PurR-regulated permease PerM